MAMRTGTGRGGGKGKGKERGRPLLLPPLRPPLPPFPTTTAATNSPTDIAQQLIDSLATSKQRDKEDQAKRREKKRGESAYDEEAYEGMIRDMERREIERSKNQVDRTVPDNVTYHTPDHFKRNDEETPPYARPAYLDACRNNALKNNCGTNTDGQLLQFFVTSTETLFAPKIFKYEQLYSYKDNKPSYFSSHYLLTGDGQPIKKQYYKDVIFLKGRTVNGGKPVFAFVEYNLKDYGPRFFLEAREGFDSCSYFEPPEVMTNIPEEAAVMDMTGVRGVDKFMRWLMNRMFFRKKKQRIHATSIDPHNITSYGYHFNKPKYKTFYGHIPEPERGGPDRHILEIGLLSKTYAQKLFSFFETDEYLNLVQLGIVPTIRSFETNRMHSLDAQWRFQHDINFNQCYQTTTHKTLTSAVIKSTFSYPVTEDQDAYYITFKYNALTKVLEKDPSTAEGGMKIPNTLIECTNPPLSKCQPTKIAFDLEVYTPYDALVDSYVFCTAKWTSEKYATRYRPLLGNYSSDDFKEIKNAKKDGKPCAETARRKLLDLFSTTPKYVQYCNNHKKLSRIFKEDMPLPLRRFELNKLIPKLGETDPINVVAFVMRKNEVGTEIKSDYGCYIFTWKSPGCNNCKGSSSTFLPLTPVKDIYTQDGRKVVPKPLQIPNDINLSYAPNVTHGNDYFDNCTVKEYDSEFEMLHGMLTFFHRTCPDFYIGHNIMNFDIPYITDRFEVLCQNDPKARDKMANNPYSFSIFRGHHGSCYNYSFQRNNNWKTTWTTDAPGTTFLDTSVAFRHETFGNKSKTGYSLAALMPAWLTYPGTDDPMRKLEIDLHRSNDMWHEREDGLFYFLGYCLYDAVGSGMLAERINFINSAFSIAETSGATISSIYLRGVQNINSNMFSKEIWNNGKHFLFPDYGNREFHFMDLWYWQYGDTSDDTNEGTVNIIFKKTGKKYKDVRWLYENIPCLKRKWQFGGIRHIPHSKEDEINNPYLPKESSDEAAPHCYSTTEAKEKKKKNLIPKSKAYMGALCLEVVRQFLMKFLLPTWDFSSMYPTSAEANRLDFPNYVTEFMMRTFNIPKYQCLQIILGPETHIQFGDVMEDKAKADYLGYVDSPKLVYCYYYQETNPEYKIFTACVCKLFAERKIAKNHEGDWGRQVKKMRLNIYLMEYFMECMTVNGAGTILHKDKLTGQLTTIRNTKPGTKDENGKNLTSEDLLGGVKYLDSILATAKEIPDDGTLLHLWKYITKIIIDDSSKDRIPLSWPKGWNKDTLPSSSVEEIQSAFLSSLLKSNFKKAKINETVYGIIQNIRKLIMNSGYGNVSMAEGFLPQITLGSSITATCRLLTHTVSKIIENLDVISLIEKIGCGEELEKILGKSLASIRANHPPEMIYAMCIIYGDTDSVGATPDDELCPHHALDLFRKKICPAIANEIHRYLPYKLKTAKFPTLTKEEIFPIDKATGKRKPFNPIATNHIEKDMMAIITEKVSLYTSVIVKKNNVQYTIMDNDAIQKTLKGIAAKKSDTLPFEVKLELEIINKFIFNPLAKDETHGQRAVKILKFVRGELIKLLKGIYNPADFIFQKTLAKPVEMYKSVPQHGQVALLRESRGQEVKVGDKIPYVFIIPETGDTLFSAFSIKRIETAINRKKPLGKGKPTKTADELLQNMVENVSDTAIKKAKNVEDAEYALTHDSSLDMDSYFSGILTKQAILLAPLFHSFRDYPRIGFGVTAAEKKAIKKQQKAIESSQQYLVLQLLKMGRVQELMNQIHAYRLQRQYIHSNSGGSSSGLPYLPDHRIHRCIHCSGFYEKHRDNDQQGEGIYNPILMNEFIKGSKERPGLYGLCNECQGKQKVELINHYQEDLKKEKQEWNKCLETCWNCIKNTKISIRTSVIVRGLDQSKLANEELYYSHPDQCKLTQCDTHQKKKKIKYNLKKFEQKISIIKALDW